MHRCETWEKRTKKEKKKVRKHGTTKFRTGREARGAQVAGTDETTGNVTHPVEYSPFFGIEKGLVLQESRVFHDSHLDSRKCQQVITKLLYLINQGESLTKVR